jgi:hypothetical protein
MDDKNSDIQHFHREIILIGVEKVTLSAAMSGALLFKQLFNSGQSF